MKLILLYVHSSNETFVQLDLEILSSSFQIIDFQVPKKFPFDLFSYWKSLRQADIIFCWFASWNAFWILLLSKLFKKPSILVIGGYDVANVPTANYGHQRGGLSKIYSRWAMHLADYLLPFSEYSLQEACNNAGIISRSMQVAYIGVPDPFGELVNTLRPHMALTVGNVEWANMKRKGLEPFVRAAHYLPDVQFVVVGKWRDGSIDYLRSIASSNVIFTGRVTDEVLVDYYRNASVYVQASLHEGFGLSVAEAMLGGCIPVVTRVGSLPEVVGDCGYFCETNQPELIADTVRTALASPFSARFQARNRILTEFPLQRRKEILQNVINALL